MVVEVYDVVERVAEVVTALGEPYVRADDPTDPGTAPQSQIRVFAVLAPMTVANGTRDRETSAMEVSTRIVVRVQAPIEQSGPSRVERLRDEMKAEPQLIRAMLVQGPPWSHGLRISYAGTERRRLADGWAETDHQFDIRHQVAL